MDPKTIRPQACLCWRAVRPNRAIKTVLCCPVAQPQMQRPAAPLPRAPPLEGCLLNPGAGRVTASHCCSLLQHLPKRKHTQRLGLAFLSRAVSRPLLGCHVHCPLEPGAVAESRASPVCGKMALSSYPTALIPQVSLVGTHLISQQISKQETTFRSSKRPCFGKAYANEAGPWTLLISYSCPLSCWAWAFESHPPHPSHLLVHLQGKGRASCLFTFLFQHCH